MRPYLVLALLVALALGAASALSAQAPPSRPETTAFVHVDVLARTGTGDEAELLRDRTVVVRGDRIVAVAPAAEAEVPAGARAVDGRGRVLIPGLADMHVHLPPETGAPGDGAWRTLALMVTRGVTTARGLAGHPAHLELRERIAADDLLGPTLYVAAPAIHAGNTPSAEAAREAVRAAKAAGYDLVKSHHLPDPEVWAAVQEEARKAGLPVSGHVANTVGLERAMAADQQIEHLDGFVAALLPPDSEAARSAAAWGQVPPAAVLTAVDRSRLPALAAAMAESGTWNTPTLALFERITDVSTPTAELRGRPEMRYLSPTALDHWSAQREQLIAAGVMNGVAEPFQQLRREVVAALHRAGAPLLAGSDTPQAFLPVGFGLHEEIEALAGAGLPPAAALDAATAAPARYLRSLPGEGSATGIAADFGTVEPGRRADLVLLDEDPLEDVSAVRSIQGVMLRGRWLDRQALDRLEDEIARAAAGTPSEDPEAEARKPATETAGLLGTCDRPGLPAGARCGTLEVPEDRSRPEGRKIGLAVVLLPAVGGPASEPPLALLAGGPGQGAADVAPGVAQLLAPLREGREILLVDQRGTGGSNRLACTLFDHPGEALPALSPEDPERIRACREALEEHADLTLYTTPHAVEDLEAVREALGYERLDLFGMSYGSRVALEYLRRHPESVRAVVIRAAAPTDLRLPLWTPRDAQESLERVAAACAAQPACAAAFPDPVADVEAVLARLARQPATVTVPSPADGSPLEATVDRDGFAASLFFLLYVPEFYVHLPRLVAAAADGDLRPLVATVLPVLLSTQDHVAWGLRWSVLCSEDLARIEPAEIGPAAAGTFFGPGVVEADLEACRLWPRAELPEGFFEPVEAEHPVLVISGTADPVAPPRWGELVTERLPNARHLVAEGAAHMPVLPGCTAELTRRFLETGSAEGLDAGCLADTAFPAFVVPAAEPAR